MPGKRPRRALPLATALTAVQTTAVLAATYAYAVPSPTPSPTPTPGASTGGPCDLIRGPAKDYCESGSGRPGTSPNTVAPGDPADPLTSLARGCADAAVWVVDTLSKFVKTAAKVDFTNPAFLGRYAVVFAAATILTLVLWLLAVTKRAIRGCR